MVSESLSKPSHVGPKMVQAWQAPASSSEMARPARRILGLGSSAWSKMRQLKEP